MPKKYFSWIALIIGVVFAFYSYLDYYRLLMRDPSDGVGNNPHYNSASIYPDSLPKEIIDELYPTLNFHLNDSLPHYQYKKIQDSIDLIKRLKEQRLEGSPSKSYGLGLLSICGMTKPNYELNRPGLYNKDSIMVRIGDSLKNFINKNNTDYKKTNEELEFLNKRMNDRGAELSKIFTAKLNTPEEFYLSLKGYSLYTLNPKWKFDSKQFLIVNDKYILVYTKWDSVKKNKYDTFDVGHSFIKEIPVRYSEKLRTVLIPITKLQYNWLSKLFIVVRFLISVFFLYLAAGLPAQIVFNISRGKAFIQKNINYLYFMSAGFFVFNLIELITPYFFDYIFRNTIPKEFHLTKFSLALSENYNLFLLSIAFFIVAKAFKRGYQLQQEQDLTV